jgi:hypothetical protein
LRHLTYLRFLRSLRLKIFVARSSHAASRKKPFFSAHGRIAPRDVVGEAARPLFWGRDRKDGSNYADREGPIRLHADFTARLWEAFGCAPLIVAGPELAAARALVGRFAATRSAA